MGVRNHTATRRVLVVGAVLLLSFVILTGLTSQWAAGQVNVTARIDMRDALTFEPNLLLVNPGANISLFLVNAGVTPHTFTLFNETNVTPRLDNFEALATFNATAVKIVDVTLNGGDQVWANFSAPEIIGNYVFVCMILGHAAGGMHGLLVSGQVAGPEIPAGSGGVALRAYWIGLIGLFGMVAIIIVSYFIIKYESRHHTDHREHRRRGLP